MADSVLIETPFHLFTNGWQTIVTEQLFDFVPKAYIKPENSSYQESYHITKDILAKYNIDYTNNEFWVQNYHSADYGSVNSCNFGFEVDVKNPVIDGGLPCQNTLIYFVFENNMAVIPICDIGCVSDLYLYFCGYYKSGKDTDLSALGTSLDDWLNVKCIVEDKKTSFFYNEEEIYSFQFDYDVGNLKYINIVFKGSGSFKNPKLYNSNSELVKLD